MNQVASSVSIPGGILMTISNTPLKPSNVTVKDDLAKPKKWEYLVFALVCLSLPISCIILSHKKFFWLDELLSFYLLSDNSFSHMLVAFSDELTNTPPLYFILGWIWTKTFGSTELSLRLFSSLGIYVACVVVWITLRRNYNFWSASIGTLGVFCVAGIILEQNAEARMYGLLLAVCALGLLTYDILSRNPRCSWVIFIANTFIHTTIVQTHLFGGFYSGAILFALIIRDRCFLKRFRVKVYLSIILSWLSLIPYIVGPFLHQIEAGKPHSWLPVPHRYDLVNYFISSFSPFALVIATLILISSLQFIFKFQARAEASDISEGKNQNYVMEASLLIFAYAFLAVPVFTWLISRFVKPIFLERYLIPTTIGWSILLAYLSSHIISPTSYSSQIISKKTRAFGFLVNRQGLFLLTLTAILILNPIHYAKGSLKPLFPGIDDNKYGYSDLPIVVELSNDFVQRFHYSPQHYRYFFPLDWQAALDKESGLWSTQEYKTMEALKRVYPNIFNKNIVQSQDFLNTHDRFLVLRHDVKCIIPTVACMRWFEVRIKSNPNYKITNLGNVDVNSVTNITYVASLFLVEAKNK